MANMSFQGSPTIAHLGEGEEMILTKNGVKMAELILKCRTQTCNLIFFSSSSHAPQSGAICDRSKNIQLRPSNTDDRAAIRPGVGEYSISLVEQSKASTPLRSCRACPIASRKTSRLHKPTTHQGFTQATLVILLPNLAYGASGPPRKGQGSC